MITRRDLTAGLIAAGITLACVSVAQEPAKLLDSTAWQWSELQPKKTDVGELRNVVRQPTRTLDELEMHITTLNPGQTSHPPHQHVNEELIILREGECETLSDGKWVHVGPGSVVFNASNSLHGFRNVGKVPAVYHVINWSPNKEMAAKNAPAKSGE